MISVSWQSRAAYAPGRSLQRQANLYLGKSDTILETLKDLQIGRNIFLNQLFT